MYPEPDILQTESEAVDEQRQRYAFLISIVAGTLLAVAYAAGLIVRGFGPTERVILSVGILTTCSAFLSAYLARRGKTTVGLIIMMTFILIAGLVETAVSSGVGFLVAIGSGLLFVGIIIQIFPRHLFRRAFGAVAISTAVIIIFDLLWPGVRRTAPPNVLITQAIILGAALLFLLYIIFRNFNNYTVSTKLVAATLLAAFLAIFANTTVQALQTLEYVNLTVGREFASHSARTGQILATRIERGLESMETLSIEDSVIFRLEQRNLEYPIATADIEAVLLEREEEYQNSTQTVLSTFVDPDLTDTLRRFKTRFPLNSDILVTDANGGIVAATSRPDAFYFGREQWWASTKQLQPGEFHIGRLVELRGEDSFGIEMSTPIYDLAVTKVIGVIRIVYSLSEFNFLLRPPIELGNSTGVVIVVGDQQLSLIDESIFLEPLKLETIAVTTMLDDLNQPYGIEPYDGSDRLVSVVKMETTGNVPAIDKLGWSVMVHQLVGEAYIPLFIQLQTNVLLGLAILVGTAITALLIGNALTRPLSQLTTTAVSVMDGDYDARANIGSKDEFGVLGRAIDEMTVRLRDNLRNLEIRVDERTRALQLSSEVSRRLSNILDLDKLVAEVVKQVQDAFDYYHVHIYLFDERSNQLRLAGGTGAAGQKMLEEQHALPRGQGLVGRAADMNFPVLVPDVTKDANFIANPLLPETKAEIAVPIVSAGEILGVLDVQVDEAYSVGQNDVNVLQAIANQVGTALRNAQSYQETQRLAEQQALLNSITRKIQQSTKIEDALLIAIRELGYALGASQTAIRFSNDIRQNKQDISNVNGTNEVDEPTELLEAGD